MCMLRIGCNAFCKQKFSSFKSPVFESSAFSKAYCICCVCVRARSPWMWCKREETEKKNMLAVEAYLVNVHFTSSILIWRIVICWVQSCLHNERIYMCVLRFTICILVVSCIFQMHGYLIYSMWCYSPTSCFA